MCLGGMIIRSSGIPRGRYATGRRRIISEEIGRRGMRRAADL